MCLGNARLKVGLPELGRVTVGFIGRCARIPFAKDTIGSAAAFTPSRFTTWPTLSPDVSRAIDIRPPSVVSSLLEWKIDRFGITYGLREIMVYFRNLYELQRSLSA